jgi:hypothetical protein
MAEIDQSLSKSSLPSDDLIEIHDPEIDPAAIMIEIRERIQKRRQELGFVAQHFSVFGGARFAGRPDDIPYDPDFYDHLEMVNQLYPEVETGIDLQPSPALRVPILGSLWARIREQAHHLVLYYLNREVSHQMSVNRELVSVLNRVEAILLDQKRAIMQLEDEVVELRQRLADSGK